ncbi:hypothetical protein ACGF5M_04710 [Gemmatimonadota bacterium]
MTRIPPHRATAIALTLLALIAGVVQVGWPLAGGSLPAVTDAGYIPRQIGYGLFAIATACLGGVILVKAPPHRPLSLVAVTLALMGLPLLGSGAGAAILAAGAPRWLFNTLASLAFFLSLAATYRLSQSFPYPQRLGRWVPWGPWMAALVAWGADWAGILPLTPRVGMAWAFGVAVASLMNWRGMYRAADADGRRRILWLAQGLVAFVVVGGLQMALVVLVQTTPLRIPIPGWEYWLRTVALFSALGFLALAVFYRGALDPGLVLRRTALYGLGGVVLVFVFTAIEDLSAAWLAERLGLGENAGSWFAGGVVALLLGPIHSTLSKAAGKGSRPGTEAPQNNTTAATDDS